MGLFCRRRFGFGRHGGDRLAQMAGEPRNRGGAGLATRAGSRQRQRTLPRSIERPSRAPPAPPLSALGVSPPTAPPSRPPATAPMTSPVAPSLRRQEKRPS